MGRFQTGEGQYCTKVNSVDVWEMGVTQKNKYFFFIIWKENMPAVTMFVSIIMSIYETCYIHYWVIEDTGVPLVNINLLFVKLGGLAHMFPQ